MTNPVLIFGYGNLSRGDDALGPLLVDFIEQTIKPDSVEIQTDFQLQIEHALDLADRTLVLFIDASVACKKSFDFCELSPRKDNTYTTHAMSPSAVMSVFFDLKHQSPPPCFLLSIQGERFELGEDLSPVARENLVRACRFSEQLLKNCTISAWRTLTAHA